jgi:hypothetical protein
MSDLDDFRAAKDEFFRRDQQSPLTPGATTPSVPTSSWS